MARILDGVSRYAGSGSASELCVEASNQQPYRVGFKQVIASLCAAPQLLQDYSSSYEAARDGTITLEGDEINTMEVLYLHQGLLKVLLGPSEKARMARPSRSPIPIDEDKGYLCTDCGASITITGSLANTTDFVERNVMNDMAESNSDVRKSLMYEFAFCQR